MKGDQRVLSYTKINDLIKLNIIHENYQPQNDYNNIKTSKRKIFHWCGNLQNLNLMDFHIYFIYSLIKVHEKVKIKEEYVYYLVNRYYWYKYNS